MFRPFLLFFFLSQLAYSNGFFGNNLPASPAERCVEYLRQPTIDIWKRKPVLNTLYIGLSATGIEQINLALMQAGFTLKMTCLVNSSNLQTAYECAQPDVIFCGYRYIPTLSSIEVLHFFENQKPLKSELPSYEPPIFVITSPLHPFTSTTMLTLMEEGAADCLDENKLCRLAPALYKHLRMRSELRNAKTELWQGKHQTSEKGNKD